MKPTDKFIIDCIRAYLVAYKAQGHGSLSRFGGKYGISRPTMSRIINDSNYEPKFKALLAILAGIKENPLIDIEKNLTKKGTPPIVGPLKLKWIGDKMGDKEDLFFKFADLISYQSLVDGQMFQTIVNLVEIMHSQLSEKLREDTKISVLKILT